jgi:hypothetical protein
MNPRYRKVAVFVGAAALAGAAGVGIASQGSADATGTNGPMTRPAGAGPQSGMGRLSGLADELGVSESELQAALQDIGPPTGGAASFAEALARELGISATKVQEALEAARPDGGMDGPPAGAPPGGGVPPAGAPSAPSDGATPSAPSDATGQSS